MKSFIFDLDGTLIHSALDIQAAANKMLADINLAPIDLATTESFIGNGIPTFVERCLAIYDVPLSDAPLNAMREYYDADPATLTTPYPGVVDCLKTLQAKGVKMAVCTNKPLAPALTIIEGLGLAGYFDIVVGGDTYAHNKPHSEPLLGCVSRLGVDFDDCIYVGDSETDALTAANTKMTFALFSGGYRNTSTDEMANDFLFDHFDEFTKFAMEK